MKTISEKINKSRDFILILLFLIALVLPAADKIFLLDETSPSSEKREFSTLPAFPRSKESLIQFPEKFEAYYNDNFGFRNALIQWHSFVKLRWLGESPNPEVVLGKDGWFYLNRDQSIDDFAGQVTLTTQELEMIRINLEVRFAWMEDHHIPYVMAVAPNKETIYPEHMPSRLRNPGRPTRLDQILSYLKEYSHLPILDLRPPESQAKSLGTLYFKTDSHWNPLGAYVGYREILHALSKTRPSLRPKDLSEFDLQVKIDLGQDLANLMALTNSVEEETTLLIPKTPRQAKILRPADLPEWQDKYISTHPDSKLPVAILLRDSFGDEMVPFLAEHFRRALYPRHTDNDFDLILREKPDLVIEEYAERLFPAWTAPNPPEINAMVFSKRFETLSDTRLLVRPADKGQGLQPLDQTEIRGEADAILVQAPEGGPGILLPAMEYPTDQTLLFALDITFPANTVMKVYYKSRREEDYSDDRSYAVEAKAGRQKIYFELPARRLVDLLRLDLGSENGPYLIHWIEARLATHNKALAERRGDLHKYGKAGMGIRGSHKTS